MANRLGRRVASTRGRGAGRPDGPRRVTTVRVGRAALLKRRVTGGDGGA
ncbi:hypothetical protein ABNG02_12915 [Halorubrum ejinorense]|uniref:Uncharacterized protein n=1 Tax=Halorubrum ejinorense TaxID=425309 RepID=A0ABV4INV5_9EURY